MDHLCYLWLVFVMLLRPFIVVEQDTEKILHLMIQA